MRTCQHCQREFDIADRDLRFYEKISPVFNGKKYSIPPPVLCPPCRERQRLTFRNERYYYPRQCDLCHKKIISVYDPAHIKNVYCHDCWWSEKWDPLSYGKDYDLSRPFFEQYKTLFDSIPKLAMMNDNGAGSENSEYTYDISRCKNAYLVIATWHAHDSFYGFQINHTEDCVDNYFVNESRLMYNSAMCEKCYSCQECAQCSESLDCIFGYNLRQCKDCIMCANLRGKQYCILNKQYSKEEYFEKKAELQLSSWQKREAYRAFYNEFLLKIPRKYANLINCENCTGDNLVNCKDSEECYNQRNLHDCKWMSNGDGGKDSYECWCTGAPELCYNCLAPDLSYNVFCSVYCWQTKNTAYSDNCHSCNDIFGCTGLRRKQYCILNKQYSKEEYFNQMEKIARQMMEAGEWGSFFPPFVAPFAYNETPAQEWHPLSQEDARTMGYRWTAKLPGSYEKETISWNQVPDDINDLSEDLSSHIFPCIQCHKNYKIQKKEFAFYKTNQIPLPRLCIDCRYERRKEMINPRAIYARQCARCSADIQTTYSPDRPEVVLCEKCYLKEVY